MDTDDKATPADEDRVDYLIARGQAFRGEPDQYAEFITELADVLEAERDRADRAELELNAVTSLDVDHFTDIWDSLPRVSYTTRVAMAQAAVELIKQATA